MFRKLITVILMMLFAGSSLHAANPLPDTESELIDIWGAVFYCQAIYEEPDVRNRIYEGDRTSCNKAHRALGLHALDRYPDEEVRTLYEHAQHKAAVIRYNTRSVQEAVSACRELCSSYDD